MPASPYDIYALQSDRGAADHAQGPPRKKMRKGTKSCIECRRRKIKCTFEPGRTAICNECYARGSTCIDQEHGDVQVLTNHVPAAGDAGSLKERVSQLEDLVKQVLDRLPTRQDGTPVPTTAADQIETQAGIVAQNLSAFDTDDYIAEVLKSLRVPAKSLKANIDESLYFHSLPKESAPVLSLFDNAVISTKEVPATVSRDQYNKTKTVIAALLSMLPPAEDLETVLESSQEWWAIWKTMFPDITDSRFLTIKESVSHTLRSEKPAEVGKIMLCIALSVHQLPPDFDWGQVSLKESPSEVMERYIATVDRLIVSDEEIAATVDGIECMVLMAKWQINMGRPRKAWLLFNKAIAFAKLLGLHRLPQRPPKERDAQCDRQLLLWCHLVIPDRYLSLMLGLPYSVSDAFCAPAWKIAKSMTNKIGGGEAFFYEVMPLITRIIDRNQDPAGTPYSVTMGLENEFEEAQSKMEPSWWSTERLPGSTIEEYFERLQAQFFFHHTRLFLHMPFMLRSSADKRYQYSHTATLESARAMIKCYDGLRGSDEIGPHACKMIDFQAFTAAMILVLNLIGYSQHSRGALPQQPDLDQDQEDSRLIDLTIQLLNGAKNEAGGSVAVNSARALELLAQTRHGCPGNRKEIPYSCQVSIPYFGTITLTPGKQFVPIKPGTYPDAGAGRPKPPCMPPQSGLPTPPSTMTSGSNQPSPRESLVSMSENTRQSPYWNPAAHPQTNLDPTQNWRSSFDDSSFITFDSFMAFPSAAQIDFSNTNMDHSSNGALSTGGSVDYMMQQPAFNGLGSVEERNMSAGFPFPNASGGNVDLDGGWNWFGVGAPVL